MLIGKPVHMLDKKYDRFQIPPEVANLVNQKFTFILKISAKRSIDSQDASFEVIYTKSQYGKADTSETQLIQLYQPLTSESTVLKNREPLIPIADKQVPKQDPAKHIHRHNIDLEAMHTEESDQETLLNNRAQMHLNVQNIKKRSQYSVYKEEFLLNPSEKLRRIEESKLSRKKELNVERIGLLPRSEVTDEEHPLSFGRSSLWNQYFQESEILEQIDRDVKRTHPDIPFFSAKSNQESLRRILIIFSKLNPSIRYVQGMNEVLAPLFYVFKNDPDTSNSAAAEADTYFCFVELLSGFRDNYCKHLDSSSVGIQSTLSKLSQLLKRHDEELWRHMEVTTQVYPQYYAFRWITLLLTMEFSFNTCIHIWDAILGDPEGPPDTLLRICCAMLILVRKRLLAGDFTANIQLLQHYPATNIDHLLHIANRLRGIVAS